MRFWRHVSGDARIRPHDHQDLTRLVAPTTCQARSRVALAPSRSRSAADSTCGGKTSEREANRASERETAAPAACRTAVRQCTGYLRRSGIMLHDRRRLQSAAARSEAVAALHKSLTLRKLRNRQTSPLCFEAATVTKNEQLPMAPNTNGATFKFVSAALSISKYHTKAPRTPKPQPHCSISSDTVSDLFTKKICDW